MGVNQPLKRGVYLAGKGHKIRLFVLNNSNHKGKQRYTVNIFVPRGMTEHWKVVYYRFHTSDIKFLLPIEIYKGVKTNEM